MDSRIKNTNGSHIFRNSVCNHCAMCSDISYCFARCNAEFFKDDYGFLVTYDNNGEVRDAVTVRDDRENKFYMCARAESRSRSVHFCADVNEYRIDAVYNASLWEYVTEDYAHNYLCYCEECGDYVEPCDYDSDHDVCKNCLRSLSPIQSWHDNKGNFEPYTHECDNERDKRLLIGFEQEIDRDSYDESANIDSSIWIDTNFLYHFVFENDCSLNYGYEIILNPHSVRALNALDIERYCKYLQSCGYVSHDTTTCGLHLHFSTDWCGDNDTQRRETLFRVINFYEAYFEEMLTLSRRESYRSYADKNSRENYFDDFDDIDTVLSANIHGSRYVAVNCTNFYRGCGESTIEFRLGRGTLNADTLRAWIDIHIAILNYCRETSSTLDFNGIKEFCTERARAYISKKLNIVF